MSERYQKRAVLDAHEHRKSCSSSFAGIARTAAGAGLALALLTTRPAPALDKQGSAHGGEVGGASAGFDVSGALMLGASLYNPSYAARPNNTGLALFRYAGHADVDWLGRWLSLPVDINTFTDRTAPGAGAFVPTELDLIVGVTSTLPIGRGAALELGVRGERDGSIGGSDEPPPRSQSYVDVRARCLYELSAWVPDLPSTLGGGDVTGWATLGWFAYNPSYAARPNNTGIALFRYALHTELWAFDRHVALGLDATFFTDRKAGPLAPSEIDLTPEIILARRPFTLHLAYERDMPLGGNGAGPPLVQDDVYVLLSYEFDFDRARDRAKSPPAQSLGAP